MSRSLSLYIHIPFCASLCDYCDFYSEVRGQGSGVRGFLDAIIQDIENQVEYFDVDRIPTVYIGGGTPSVLGADIKILLDALKSIPAFKPREFTIEANPESLTEEFLDVCKEGGVNRLSLGVQTFFEPSRNAVNRAGNVRLLEERLALASRCFPGALSVDLITGMPFQSEEIVLEDIKRLLSFDPAHVSLYSLTLETGTILEKKVREKTVTLPDGDSADLLWLAGRDALLKAGFKYYEVSSFAREGCECLHNIRYWQMAGWLGAGPAASGTVIDEKTCSAVRYTYAPNVEKYVRGLRGLTRIMISRDELIREIILMGYRYCDGPDPKWGVEKYIPETLEKWKDRDIMLFLNNLLLDAFKELRN